MKKITYLIILLIVTATAAKAQQGFGTSTPAPSSVIDMTAANKGALLPRVALKGLRDNATIPAAADALTVFNTATTTLGTANDVTPGYYYWNITTHKWVRLLTGTDAPVNIYNADGTLTENRTVTMNGNTLKFDGDNASTLFQGGALQYLNNLNTGGLASYGLRTTSSQADFELFDGNSAQLAVGSIANPLPLFIVTSGDAPIMLSTNNTPRAVITSAGNVGIGTIAPASTLEVAGTVSTPIITTTGSLDLTSGDYYTVIYTGGTTNPTFALPDPTTCKGRMYRLVNASRVGFNYHDVTLSLPVTLYNGGTTTTLTVITYTTASISDPTIGNTALIQSDGTQWWRIGL